MPAAIISNIGYLADTLNINLQCFDRTTSVFSSYHQPAAHGMLAVTVAVKSSD